MKHLILITLGLLYIVHDSASQVVESKEKWGDMSNIEFVTFHKAVDRLAILLVSREAEIKFPNVSISGPYAN